MWDFATGLIVFWIVAVPTIWGCDSGIFGPWPSSARAHFQAWPHDSAVASVLQGPSLLSFVCLATAFAFLFAFNLWFVRHIRRVHATYRRRC